MRTAPLLIALSLLVACSEPATVEPTVAAQADTTVSTDSAADTTPAKADTTQSPEDTSEADTARADSAPPPADTEDSDTGANPEDTAVEADTTPTPDTVPSDTDSPDSSPGPVSVSVDEGQSAALSPPPPGPTPRPRRRMNLDQLQRSIARVTGLTDWVDSSANLFEEYASPLGRPDFESTVLEELTPGLFFEKTLGDFARYICPLLMDKESATPPEDRVFIMDPALTDTYVTAPELVEKNLRTLLLHYHGRFVPPGSPEMARWINLFQAGTNSGAEAKPIEGWSLVCTALLSHPAFFSY